MNKVRYFIALVGIIFFGVSFAEVSKNSTFTPSEKKQIENIIENYLIKNPEVLAKASIALQKKQMEKEKENITKASIQNINELLKSSNNPTFGNTKGDVTLIEFFDYNCSHCKEMSFVVKNLMKKDKNIRVIFREFPVFGENSLLTSKAALAAFKQNKYMEFHEVFMKSKKSFNDGSIMNLAKVLKLNINQFEKDRRSKSVGQIIINNFELAKKLGIRETPVIIVTKTQVSKKNNRKVFVQLGSGSVEELRSEISKVRK